MIVLSIILKLFDETLSFLKKRSEQRKERKRFLLTLEIDLHNVIVNLFCLESSFKQYEHALHLYSKSDIESIGFTEYDFIKKWDLPNSFLDYEKDLSKNIHSLQNTLKNINDFSRETYEIIMNIQKRIIKEQISKEEGYRLYSDELKWIKKNKKMLDLAINKTILILSKIKKEDKDILYKNLRESFDKVKTEEMVKVVKMLENK